MLLYSEEDDNVATVEEAVIVRPPCRECLQPPGKALNIDRRRVFYGTLLHQDFWGPTPVYSAAYFKLFFKLPLALFDEILDRVVLHDSYFVQKEDA